MQTELDGESTTLAIQIVGVNEIGHESGNDDITDERDLPWLQEEGASVWDAWNVTYRDVIILDSDNEIVTIYNLTDNDLGDAANYDTLKQHFLDAAAE